MNTLHYHIRRKLIKSRSNEYYLDRRNRGNGTYCDRNKDTLLYTTQDIRWKEKAIVAYNGDTDTVYTPCPRCVKVRAIEDNIGITSA